VFLGQLQNCLTVIRNRIDTWRLWGGSQLRLSTKSKRIEFWFITTSGYPWPSDTVKSPGFFKPRERHRKAQSSFFFNFKNLLFLKSPPWKLLQYPKSATTIPKTFWKVTADNFPQWVFSGAKVAELRHTQSGPDPARHPVLDVGYPWSPFRARMS